MHDFDQSRTFPLRTNSAYEATKRILDIVGAAVGLIVLAPVLGGVALAIKLDGDGPVLYFRLIVGRDKQQFHAIKFRTMVVNAESHLATNEHLLQAYQANMKLQNDPRVTRVGRFLRKTSLDELPQLVNVLRGQMSLVGPRMIHPREVDRFGEFFTARQRVRPGMTGLWQVSGRSGLSYEQRIALDRCYLERRSLWLDLWILLKTTTVVLSGSGE